MSFLADVSGVPYEKYVSIQRIRQWIDARVAADAPDADAAAAEATVENDGRVPTRHDSLARAGSPLSADGPLSAPPRAGSAALSAAGSRAAVHNAISCWLSELRQDLFEVPALAFIHEV